MSDDLMMRKLIETLNRVTEGMTYLQNEQRALTQGVMVMVEIQEAHGELLKEILEVASPMDGDEPNPMEALIRSLEVALSNLTAQVGSVGQGQMRLAGRLAGAIVRGASSPDDADSNE